MTEPQCLITQVTLIGLYIGVIIMKITTKYIYFTFPFVANPVDALADF